MNITEASCPLSKASPTDPTIEVAERQLAMLGEVAQMAMALSRAHAASALAAAHAVEVILADEIWQPETGRARALAGSRDAAEAFQKVSRSLRLTLVMEMAAAETVRELRAGVVPAQVKRACETPALRLDPLDQASPSDRRRPAGSCSDDRAPDFDRCGSNTERLVEFERPDRLPRGSFREVVGGLCADLGVTPDWNAWSVGHPDLEYEPLKPKPPGWTETRPPGVIPRSDHPGEADRSTHPPP